MTIKNKLKYLILFNKILNYININILYILIIIIIKNYLIKIKINNFNTEIKLFFFFNKLIVKKNIIINKYIHLFFNNNFYVYYLKLYLFNFKKFLVNFKKFFFFKNNFIINQIIFLKKISNTKKKGRIKKIKIIILLSNSIWYSIGVSKHYFIFESLEKAKLNSLNNIFWVKLNKLNTSLYELQYKYNYNYIIMKPIFFNSKLIVPLFLKNLFILLGYKNIFCKILGSNNKFNIILSILFIIKLFYINKYKFYNILNYKINNFKSLINSIYYK